MGRYKRQILAGLGLLMVFVLVLTFSFEDGGVVWRGGLKYQSGFQISVVPPGTASLSEPEDGGNLSGTAAQYADLLRTGEAAIGIGEMSGYVLNETVNANTARNSSVISGTVIGPTPDLAMTASQNAFVWLAQKVQQPLEALPQVSTTVPPTPIVDLASTFPLIFSVVIDDSLASVSPDLFVLVDTGQNQSAAVPVVQRAGGSVDAATTFEAGGSLLLNLEASDGTPYDVLRLAPGPLPRTAPAYPSLNVHLGPGALKEVEVDVEVDVADGEAGDETLIELVWVFDAAAISTEWVDGTPEVLPVAEETRQLQVAMLTDVPTAEQIGVRRGPLMGFAVLVIGLILLLTSVIVADTWRRDRDEQEISPLRTHGDEPDDGNGDRMDVMMSLSATRDVDEGDGPDVAENAHHEQ